MLVKSRIILIMRLEEIVQISVNLVKRAKNAVNLKVLCQTLKKVLNQKIGSMVHAVKITDIPENWIDEGKSKIKRDIGFCCVCNVKRNCRLLI